MTTFERGRWYLAKTWTLTDGQKLKAIELYERGESCAEIAKRYGVTREAIRKMLKRRGVEMRPRELAFYRGGSKADKSAIRELNYAVRRGEIQRPDTCERCG